ncbi:MAG: aminotransferase class V-fold PLP-dependent enzyme [Proteobacteria bacterium]|nr:aminotransferase class V-fold PLP-dependent enzyme [Pseudomonadota bacterium]
MKIDFNKLSNQWDVIKERTLPLLLNCFKNSNFILGNEVAEFEKAFAKYIGCNYAIGVSNGTDAIKLALIGLQVKHKPAVYISANTYVATLFATYNAFPDADIYLIETSKYYVMDENDLENKLKKYSKNYKNNIILPVHMFGNIGNMDRIIELSKEHNATIVEDVSQAHGTRGIDNRLAGSYGKVAAFSLYPGKNLGAFGDAGIITTDDETVANTIKMYRHLGSKEKFVHEVLGFNNRLDTVQAIILNQKLKYLDTWNAKRNEVAKFYKDNIFNKKIILPEKSPWCSLHTYHVYNILVDNVTNFSKYLDKNEIQYNFHYPIPVELMKPFEHLKQINEKTRHFSSHQISLPMHPFMEKEELQYVCDVLNAY